MITFYVSVSHRSLFHILTLNPVGIPLATVSKLESIPFSISISARRRVADSAARARASAGPAPAEGTARARRSPGGTWTRGRGEGRVVIRECNAVFPPAGASRSPCGLVITELVRASLTARRGRAHRQGRRRRGRRAQGGKDAQGRLGGEFLLRLNGVNQEYQVCNKFAPSVMHLELSV